MPSLPLSSRVSTLASLLVAGLALSPTTDAADPRAAAVLAERCETCHERQAGGIYHRISEARRTPEGWDMTLVRMMLVHDVDISPDERRVLVKHFADTQGLAPAETADYRYILERRPNAVESPPDAEVAGMCARCHSYARVALQRRDAHEWRKLVHFHLGQYPTTEYQAGGRDRDWWRIASTEIPEQLAQRYPQWTRAWSDWQARDKVDLSGTWRIAGHRPGRGAYHGTLAISGEGDDRYRLDASIAYADGSTSAGRGSAVVYTGYEWRARLTLGDETVLQIGAMSVSGDRLSGRWFLADADSLGADFTAVRAGGADGGQVLQSSPAYLRAGQTATVAIHGAGLGGEVSLGDGVTVTRVMSRTPTTVTVEARADDAAATGPRTVQVGGSRGDGLFTVYRAVDSVRVEPGYAVARVGGGGGPVPSVPAQFDAVAYANGPDGATGTDDDIRIGVMPADWSASGFDAAAKAAEDARFAGQLGPQGLFEPAAAGPNEARRYSTNNAGNLAVKATVDDAGSAVEGTGQLIVTVQRWNDPPIR